MDLKVGDKIKLIKPIEVYNFDYVGMEFEITKIDNEGLYAKSNLGIMGIDINQVNEYFELVKPIEVNHITEHEDYKVIRNGKATIVILQDGSKGISKCMECDEYDLDKGYQIALLKAEIKSKSKLLKEISK